MTIPSDPLYPVIKARAGLLLAHPFFGALALRLKLAVMSPAMEEHFRASGLTPTMAVDGSTIHVNLAFAAGLTAGQRQTVIAHEVMHCALDHLARQGPRDGRRWNIACDYVVNWELHRAGLVSVPDWLCSPQYDGMTAEQVYAQLTQDSTEKPLDLQVPRSALDGPGDAAAAVQTAAEWRVAVVQAANAARMMGKLPASLDRCVTVLTTPKVDWRDTLRRFVTARARDDYSWSRPNRVYLSLGLYAPSLYSERMDSLVAVIDTSGSISQGVLAAFVSEVQAARDAATPRHTRLIYCDCAVNQVDSFEAHEELVASPCGGGGTDFRPPFAHLQREGSTPACVVYLTDGEGPYPDSAPDYPVLWVMTGSITPPWGEHVRIDL